VATAANERVSRSANQVADDSRVKFRESEHSASKDKSIKVGHAACGVGSRRCSVREQTLFGHAVQACAGGKGRLVVVVIQPMPGVG